MKVIRHFISGIFLLFFFKGVLAQSPLLEIHHIGAGDGDGTLIIAIDKTGINPFTQQSVWDTCVVLIDAQREGGGKEVWRYVRDTIETRFPKRKKLDYIVLSHLHIDHYGGMTNIVNQAVSRGWTIDGAITRKGIVTNNITNSGQEIDTCYSDIQLNTSFSGKLNTFFRTLEYHGIEQPALTVGGNLFHTKHFQNIYMQCIVSAGTTYNQNGDGLLVFLPSAGNSMYKAKSENDLSYGWIIGFQGFHYTSFGDLGGADGSRYVDGETPVTNFLSHYFDDADYHLCVHKVSHHGSAESTTQAFAAANNIALAVIPASLRAYGRSVKPLPTQTAILNLLSNPKTTYILYTFVPNNPGTLASFWTYNNLKLYNDVIIKIDAAPDYPDYGENLPIRVIQAQKDLDYNYTGTHSDELFNCTKGHNWNVQEMDTDDK